MFNLRKKDGRNFSFLKNWAILVVGLLVIVLVVGLFHKQAEAVEDSHQGVPHKEETKHKLPHPLNHDNEKGKETNINLEPATPIKPEVPHKDHFRSMTQLFANSQEGVDWKKEIKRAGSNVIIVAPHGGNIEKGTTELTKMVANHNHYDYYSFTVLNKQNPEKFHVTSSHYNDPTLLNMVKSKDFAVSIHGAKGDKPVIYLGGLDTELKEAIKQQLLKQHFTVKIAPSYLGGDLKQNFVNRDFKDKGVQLELTTAFRKSLFTNENMSPKSRANKKNWSPVMYKFSDALDKAIKQVDDSGKDR
ncbi:hypothetical protein CD127_06920 [Staphylococcus petrasii]|uniref:poly-gamma-glutamate hydrolase family protein n=1 Tax=Staphylococcus petrasii TaxID=1276936 RepID=UPI000CD04C11|nr:hypothetical protein CD127_06920 [Staphylococcus petrasii]TGA81506.1 hypothetical protein E2554_08320 [Staphylococcus petrasii]